MRDDGRETAPDEEAALDALIRASAPTPLTPQAAERIADRVLRLRTERARRRRLLRMSAAVVLTLAGIAAAALVAALPWARGPSPSTPASGREAVTSAGRGPGGNAVTADGAAPKAKEAPASEPPESPAERRLRTAVARAVAAVEPGIGAAQARRVAAGLRPVEGAAAALVGGAEDGTIPRGRAVLLLAFLPGRPASASAAALVERAVLDDPVEARKELARIDGVLPADLLVDLTRLPALRSWAVLALGKVDAAAAGAIFLEEWRVLGPGPRREFLRSLVPGIAGRHGPFLRQAASVRDEEVRALVADLGSTGDSRVWPFLEALRPRTGLDAAFLSACGQIGAREAVPLLERALGWRDARGTCALASLRMIPGDEATEALYRAWAVARGLPFDGFLGPLEEALRDRGDEALKLLARRIREGPGGKVAVEALVRLFPDDAGRVLAGEVDRAGPAVGAAIVAALARLDDPAARDVLIRLLGDRRLSSPARRSLVQMAGVDLGGDPGAWRAWAEKRGEGKSRASAEGRDGKETV